MITMHGYLNIKFKPYYWHIQYTTRIPRIMLPHYNVTV